jgi:glucose-6-phosphate isomerase
MTTLKLIPDGLWNEALCYLAPHHAAHAESIPEKFFQFTDRKYLGSPVFSGYRFRTLERFGLSDSRSLANRLRQDFDTMLVLGIGGSALGARTAINALTWSVPPSERKKVLIADNLDPIEFEDIWSQCNPAKTVTVVISKSGGTIETMSQCSTVIERYQAAGLPLQRHIVTITDPSKGALRAWTESAQLSSLSVPEDVGGRFSVLTPVGLLPIAFAGIAVEEIVEGAVQFYEHKMVDQSLMSRVGLRFSELEAAGFLAHNLMPYSSKLKDFGAWFVQLWGESLGKIKPHAGRTGMIPLASVGATDQHSLLQLLVEGHNRIATGFVRVNHWPRSGTKKPSMGKLPSEFAPLSFAYGKSFEDILNAELTATQKVLTEQQRPTYEIRLEDAGPQGLGALFAFYMDLTSYTAAALGINPYDQPGVELGKRILPGLLNS